MHDIGYFGKKDMDDPGSGQTHPELGAKIVSRLLGDKWGDFCLFHSRFYARSQGRVHSLLCVADKLAFCFYPPRLYIFLARLSGEMKLYREFSADACELENVQQMTDLEWYHGLKRYTLRVVVETNRNYFDYINSSRVLSR